LVHKSPYLESFKIRKDFGKNCDEYQPWGAEWLKEALFLPTGGQSQFFLNRAQEERTVNKKNNNARVDLLM
jgi:hypothetical protein